MKYTKAISASLLTISASFLVACSGSSDSGDDSDDPNTQTQAPENSSPVTTPTEDPLLYERYATMIGHQAQNEFLKAKKGSSSTTSIFGSWYVFPTSDAELSLTLGDIEFGTIDHQYFIGFEDMIDGAQSKDSDAYWNRVLLLAALDYDQDISNGIGFGNYTLASNSLLYQNKAKNVSINFDQPTASFVTDNSVVNYLTSVDRQLSNDIESVKTEFELLTRTEANSVDDCDQSEALLSEGITHQVTIPANSEGMLRFCLKTEEEAITAGINYHGGGLTFFNLDDDRAVGGEPEIFIHGTAIDAYRRATGRVKTPQDILDGLIGSDLQSAAHFPDVVEDNGNIRIKYIPEGLIYLEISYINEFPVDYTADVAFVKGEIDQLPWNK
jgi:hypothetical protein